MRHLLVMTFALLLSSAPAVAQEATKPAPPKESASSKDSPGQTNPEAATAKDNAAKNNTDKDNLVKPSDKSETWRFEKVAPGEGKMKMEDGWAVFEISEVSGTDWHVQAVVPDLELKEGKDYKLTFEAKAAKARSMMVCAMIDRDDWHEIGLHEDVFVGSKPQKEEFTFRAVGVADQKKNRVSFVFGTETGTISIRNVKLVEVK